MIKSPRCFPLYLLTATLGLIGSSIAAGETTQSTVQELISEVVSISTSASDTFDQFDRIYMHSVIYSPIAIDYSHLNNSSGRTVADIIEATTNPRGFVSEKFSTVTLCYLKGIQGTFRVEIAPMISSHLTEDGEQKSDLITPGRILFRNENGELLMGLHDYLVDLKNGDVLQRRKFSRHNFGEVSTTEVYRSGRFGPDTVYTTRGIPWSGYFSRNLSLATDASKIVDDEGRLEFSFRVETPSGTSEYILEFIRSGETYLPKEYRILVEDKVAEAQNWEYGLQAGLLLPVNATLVLADGEMLGSETVETQSFTFERRTPLDLEDVKRWDPIDDQIRTEFESGKQLKLNDVVARRGIVLSGKEVELP